MEGSPLPVNLNKGTDPVPLHRLNVAGKQVILLCECIMHSKQFTSRFDEDMKGGERELLLV